MRVRKYFAVEREREPETERTDARERKKSQKFTSSF